MNLYLFKYGSYIHGIVFLVLLYTANIHPNNAFYWAFLINLGAILYFVFMRGVAFGIKHTVSTLKEIDEEDKEKQDKDFRNN